MDKFLVEENTIHGGVQKIYRFPNGFGASVVKHAYSYGGAQGLWELAVLKFKGKTWSLTYDTPITSDVLGRLSWSTVVTTLQQIQKLNGGE